MNTPTNATYEDFEAQYHRHLADPDRPSAYIAYCRAEAWHQAQHGQRRYADHKSFRNTMSRYNTQKKSQIPTAQPPAALVATAATGKVYICCQICSERMYLVPRGDLRTIIPHTCQDCIEKFRKLITA